MEIVFTYHTFDKTDKEGDIQQNNILYVFSSDF